MWRTHRYPSRIPGYPQGLRRYQQKLGLRLRQWGPNTATLFHHETGLHTTPTTERSKLTCPVKVEADPEIYEAVIPTTISPHRNS